MNRICTRLASAVLMFGLAATAAQAGELLFACTTTQGKQVAITDEGETLRYRFGSATRPELVFSSDKAQLQSGACTAAKGSYAWVILSNGGYDYMISAHDVRKRPATATLDVYRSNAKASASTLVCRKGSITNHLHRLQSVSSPCS